MTQENEMMQTPAGANAVQFLTHPDHKDLLASFLRTGFDGDVIVIYMRPERVFGLQKAKLELVFAPPVADSSVAGMPEKDGCAERGVESMVTSTGSTSFQQLAVLIEYLARTLQAQGRKAEVELEIQVSANGADLKAANELLDELASEVFA